MKTREELAAIEGHLAAEELKLRAEAQNVWLKWEPYLCLIAGLLLGFLGGHFL